MATIARVSCRLLTAIVLAAAGSSLLAHDHDVVPHRQDRPPNRPYTAQEAIRRMTVPEGFAVELVAAEPDIVNPIAMAFDDRGRIWVTESLEYPRKPAGPGRDRIKILEDTDRDGRADKVTVFADGLNIPTGVAIGHGGVWVLNAPDLLFMKERDGKAVSREVVVTGFGRTDVHELPNSLTWGPDGWLYGLNGVFNHCRIESGRQESTSSPAPCTAFTRARVGSSWSARGRATPTASPGTPKAARWSAPATGPTTTFSTSSRRAITTARPARTRRTR